MSRLYDRSRTVMDWNCPRKRYLQYELDGKGVVSGNTSLELYLGTAIHDGLAAIAFHEQLGNRGDLYIDEIASDAQKMVYEALMQKAQGGSDWDAMEFAKEQAALVEGLLRGFYRHVWPSLLKVCPTIVAVEQEMVYEHDDLTFMSKPDLVLEDEQDQLWYIEYKSTSSKKPEWVNSWNTAVQLHSTIRAIETTLKRKVAGVIVQGLYKGYESYGKQNSPFCYSYRKTGQPPFSTTEDLYEYKAGFKRYPVWEIEGGVKQWVANMPDEVLANLFPQTPPIYIKDELIDNFFKQRTCREREIVAGLDLLQIHKGSKEDENNILNTFFPQRFDQCIPFFGRGCQYQMICHGGIENPLDHGFEYRVPHHGPEMEVQNADSN